MKLVNPFETTEEPKIYELNEAIEYLVDEGSEVYVLHRGMKDFLAKLQIEGRKILVGTWEGLFWILYSTQEPQKTRTIAKEFGLDITDTGPIAVYGEDDKRLFPLQPHEDIYAISKTRQLDDQGNSSD